VGTEATQNEAVRISEVRPILPGFHKSQHEGGDMKRQALTLISVLGLLLAAGSAYAQTINVRANVPFNFIVNKGTLPAGQYSIQSLGTAAGRTLFIRSSDMGDKALVNTNGVEKAAPSEQTKLVFLRYGDRYFLSQIWVKGDSAGHQLPKSPRESEVAMDYSPQPVVVLASLK
jgi:hypothetical protein